MPLETIVLGDNTLVYWINEIHYNQPDSSTEARDKKVVTIIERRVLVYDALEN